MGIPKAFMTTWRILRPNWVFGAKALANLTAAFCFPDVGTKECLIMLEGRTVVAIRLVQFRRQ